MEVGNPEEATLPTAVADSDKPQGGRRWRQPRRTRSVKKVTIGFEEVYPQMNKMMAYLWLEEQLGRAAQVYHPRPTRRPRPAGQRWRHFLL